MTEYAGYTFTEPMKYCYAGKHWVPVEGFDLREKVAWCPTDRPVPPDWPLFKWCRECTEQKEASVSARQAAQAANDPRLVPRKCPWCGELRPSKDFGNARFSFDVCKRCRQDPAWKRQHEFDLGRRKSTEPRKRLTPEERRIRNLESDRRYNQKRPPRVLPEEKYAHLENRVRDLLARDGYECAGCGGALTVETASIKTVLPGFWHPETAPLESQRLACPSCAKNFYRRFCQPKSPSKPRKERKRYPCDGGCGRQFLRKEMTLRYRNNEKLWLCVECLPGLAPKEYSLVPYEELTPKQQKARRWNQANRDTIKEYVRMRRAKQMGVPSDRRVSKNTLLLAFGCRCFFCGRELDPESPDTHEEHLTPLARGGSDEFENRVASCRECNLPKHSKTLAEYIGYRSAKEGMPWTPWGMTQDGMEFFRNSALTVGFSDLPQISTSTTLALTGSPSGARGTT